MRQCSAPLSIHVNLVAVCVFVCVCLYVGGRNRRATNAEGGMNKKLIGNNKLTDSKHISNPLHQREKKNKNSIALVFFLPVLYYMAKYTKWFQVAVDNIYGINSALKLDAIFSFDADWCESLPGELEKKTFRSFFFRLLFYNLRGKVINLQKRM